MDELKNRGFSIIEVVIAMAMAIVVISGVVIASGGFGSTLRGYQSTILRGQTDAEALTQAEKLLEYMQSLGRQDFNLVNPIATSTADHTFFGSVDTRLQSDLLTKLVTATVSWRTDYGATSTTKLSTLVTNLDNVTSPSSCDSSLSGTWSTAQIATATEVGPPTVSGNPVTDIADFNKTLYITTSNTRGHNDDFYIYNFSTNPLSPTFVSSLDTNGVTPGVNSVAIASTSSNVYAFVSNGNGANWNTCSAGPSCAQLQVIDVTNTGTPIIVKNYKIPSAVVPFVLGSGGQAVPNIIVYKNGYLYVGLSKTSSGPEFVILDVGGGGGGATPLNPVYRGSYAIGRGVNNIFIKNNYAYLATTDNARELIILDVTAGTNPTFVASYNTAGASGFGAGNSVTGVGAKIYLGRNYVAGAPEFYAFDVTNPATPLSLGTFDPGVSPNTESINGIMVRDSLAFVVMTHFFQIWNIRNPAAISLVKTIDLGGIGVNGIASSCDGNYMFLGSYRTADDKGLLYTVYPGP